MIAPLIIAAGIGAAASLASSYLGKKGQAADAQAQKDIAQQNLLAQQQNQAQQRTFAQQLLNQSRPSMSSEQIGDLLFKQGAQARQQETDRQLQTVLRANLRAGSPSSSGELISRANAANAGTVGDLRTNATLQGLQAALPSSTAINAAAALYGGGAPQNSYVPREGLANAQFAASAGNTISGLIEQYLRYQQMQQQQGQQAPVSGGQY